MTSETIQALFDALAMNNIVPVDRYVESEEVYYFTSVYYVNDRSYFDIRGDQDSLRLFPREGKRDLKTFFEVFEIIQDVISTEATVSIDDSGNDRGGEN